jgi:hypothetical protein
MGKRYFAICGTLDKDFYQWIKKMIPWGFRKIRNLFLDCGSPPTARLGQTRGHRYLSSPARLGATRGRCNPLTAELVTEGVRMCGIRKAVAHIVLLVVVPSAATTRLDAALAVEGEHIV